MHTIRLREPWTVEFQPGRVIYRRHFNRPTGLGPGDVVRLAIDDLPTAATVFINGQSLTVDASASAEITEALLPRNAVEIIVAADPTAGQRPFGEVMLTISNAS
jgi:hypothetical protein